MYEGLRELIKNWEVSGEITIGTIQRIQLAIEETFPAFEIEIYKIEQEMTGRASGTESSFMSSEEEDDDLVPEFIRKKFSNLGLRTKVALGIGLSPLILAGLVVRLPYIGFKAIEKAISKHRLESDFNSSRMNKEKLKEVCERYAERTLKSITDKISLKAVIEEDMQVLFKFLEAQRHRMQGQIKLDIELLKKLKYEESEQAEIEKVYQPLNAKCKILQHHLKYFMLTFNPEYYLKNMFIEDVTVTQSIVCDGLIADVVLATCTDNSNGREDKRICIRRQKDKVKRADTVKYLKVLEAFR